MALATIANDRAWADALEQTNAQAPRIVADGLAQIVDRHVFVLRRETPRRSGTLQDGYTPDVQATATGATGTITNGVSYARYVWKGRGPVVAKSGRVLRFVIGGRVLFRKRVGPAKANDFVGRAEVAMEPAIALYAADTADVIVRRVR